MTNSSPALRPMVEADADRIAEIFNHFIIHDFSAYHSKPMTGAMIVEYMKTHNPLYPYYVIEIDGRVVGFGELRPIHRGDTLRRTAEVGYFFLPEYTGRGLGSMLLTQLEADARAIGADNLVASISSRNEQSLRFHRKRGFEECGRFRRAGRKFDQDFDIVWMQKFL